MESGLNGDVIDFEAVRGDWFRYWHGVAWYQAEVTVFRLSGVTAPFGKWQDIQFKNIPLKYLDETLSCCNPVERWVFRAAAEYVRNAMTCIFYSALFGPQRVTQWLIDNGYDARAQCVLSFSWAEFDAVREEIPREDQGHSAEGLQTQSGS